MTFQDFNGQRIYFKAVYSDEPEIAELPDTPKAKCEFCGKDLPYIGRGSFTLDDKLAKVDWLPHPRPCDCKAAHTARIQRAAQREQEQAEKDLKEREERRKKHIQKLFEDSGINHRFQCRTFDTFIMTNENRNASYAATRFVEQFDTLLPKPNEQPRKNGLMLIGPVGTGKTHLAAAIANELLNKGRAVICMTMMDLLERIRKTFAGRDMADESEILRTYKTVPLLVIDDLGKEKPTEWAIATVYNIINGRYEACMPTIVTSNYSPRDLVRRLTPENGDTMTAEATVDRLTEMCAAVVMDGTSWRRGERS
jgi:DNA replication protein DnaC